MKAMLEPWQEFGKLFVRNQWRKWLRIAFWITVGATIVSAWNPRTMAIAFMAGVVIAIANDLFWVVYWMIRQRPRIE